MNFKIYHVSKNLFNYATIAVGNRIQWTTGIPVADSTAIMSDFISVSPGDYSLNYQMIILGYNNNKEYVGVYRPEKTWEKRSSSLVSLFTVLDTSNISFIKLLSYGDYPPISDTLMLNVGSTSLPFEPYSSEAWHDKSNYKRSVLVWNTDTGYERSDGTWT